MGGTCSTNEGDWKDDVMFCAKFVGNNYFRLKKANFNAVQ